MTNKSPTEIRTELARIRGAIRLARTRVPFGRGRTMALAQIGAMQEEEERLEELLEQHRREVLGERKSA